MNDHRSVQLKLDPPKNGVLIVPFRGPSTREEIPTFKVAIDAQLDQYPTERAIFDMAEIHPHLNAAGRILDLACEYHENRQIKIEVRIPAPIYELLRVIEPKNMPRPTGNKPVQVRGVEVTVLSRTPEPEPGELERHFAAAPAELNEPVTLVRCEGRISDINDSTITVSLDTEEGEVVAEFHRIQFPKGRLVVGMVFEYRAMVTEPGSTSIHIDMIPPQHATEEEFEAEANAFGSEIPGLETLDK